MPATPTRPRRYSMHPSASAVDVDLLASTLRKRVAGEVRADALAMSTWSTDASNFRQLPLAVVTPLDADDLEAAIQACREVGAPVTHRGGGTSLAGQTTNAAVIIDCSKHMNRILEIDPDRRVARVQPGCVLDDLRSAAETYGLTFGPDPATHDRCTLGGMIGNNSCGTHSIMAGRTVDNVERLEVCCYDGTRLSLGAMDREARRLAIAAGGRFGSIVHGLQELVDAHAPEIRARYPDISRRVSGYNLDELFDERGFHLARAVTGSEGTCVSVLEATLSLVPSPPSRILVVLGYHDAFSAADEVPLILSCSPLAIEGIDERLLDNMATKGLRSRERALLPSGGAFLFVEMGGESLEEAMTGVTTLLRALGRSPRSNDVTVVEEHEAQEGLWAVRETGYGATGQIPGRRDGRPGWEDSAVAPERLGSYLRELSNLWDRYGFDVAMYGHFGQGCVHTRVDFDFSSPKGVSEYVHFLEEAADLVVAHGGSLSGEHGDGQQRSFLLERMFGKELTEAFLTFKRIWDPDGRMNPGKVVDATKRFGPDENLRIAPERVAWNPRTKFALTADAGSFDHAVSRCVGVGKCRKTESGVMCPSYMVTRAEEHSTRGRARLLFEMAEGEAITDGWRSEAVAEALDLCLGCKGCKVECPVSVDMATYKAEFMSHHYAGRLRPASAYSMGLVMMWARLASKAPRLFNSVSASKTGSAILRRAGGLTSKRPIPPFASQSFTSWFRDRPERDGDQQSRRKVFLFPDTFSNFLAPEVAKASTEVLERAGFAVEVPRGFVCCGRPLYDFGMLDLARVLWRTTLRSLAPVLAEDALLVVPEPSCAAAFRDELPELMKGHPNAKEISERTLTLAELLEKEAPDADLSSASTHALLQPHCHQHAVIGNAAELSVLGRAGVSVETPDAGCCGLAGSFGFEADKYDLSMACAERSLLPAVRDLDPSTAVIADGFSCRTQILHGTGRRALHLAEILNGS